MADETHAIVPYIGVDLAAIRQAFDRGRQEQTRHGHPMFYEILEELGKLHSEKNQQYATTDDPLGNFVRGGRLMSKLLNPEVDPTLAACLTYAAKQIDGVYEIVGEGKTNTVDALEDKLKDIAVYAILAMIIVRENESVYDIPTL